MLDYVLIRGQKWDSGAMRHFGGESAFSHKPQFRIGAKVAVHFILEQTHIFTFCLEMHFQIALDFAPIIWRNLDNL